MVSVPDFEPTGKHDSAISPWVGVFARFYDPNT